MMAMTMILTRRIPTKILPALMLKRGRMMAPNPPLAVLAVAAVVVAAPPMMRNEKCANCCAVTAFRKSSKAAK
jgi:hypothetical protein